MSTKLAGGLGKAISATLSSEEKIIEELSYSGGGEAIVVTDVRVLIVKAGFAAQAIFGQKVKSYPFDAITSVEVSSGLLIGRIQINVSGSSEGSGRGTVNSTAQAENLVQISRDQLPKARAIAALIEQLRAKAKNLMVSNPALLQTTLADELIKLGSLVQNGLLSREEFEIAKAKLLS
jgi:Bacterial PH domain/Short C-terminal domain